MSSAAHCLASLKIAVKKIEKEARDVIDDTSESIYTKSTEIYCPVDKGVLKGSAKNEIKKNSDSKYTRSISYNTDYAIYVHEIPYHHNHGSWKYLSIPFTMETANTSEKIKGKAGK